MDASEELKLRNVFIRRTDDSMSRDCIRTLNVMRGQSKVSSIDAMPALVEKIQSCIDTLSCNDTLDQLHLHTQLHTQLHAHICKLPPVDTIITAIIKYIAESAPITINIRPDVIKLLIANSVIKNAFEVSHTKGGGYNDWRKEKEQGCFLGLYDKNTTDSDRPKYGALNFLNTPGGIPTARNYGKWQLILKNSVRIRCTLAGENTHKCSDIGVLDFPAHILIKLTALELLQLALISTGIIHQSSGYEGSYREIQIHGTLICERDIAELHIPYNDPDITIAEDFTQKYSITLCKYKCE